jgi:DNA-binding transcriptional ArsR family regulator
MAPYELDITNPVEISTISVKIDQVQVFLNSIMLLNKIEHVSGLGEWVQKTVSSLSPEQRRNQKLVGIGLHHAYQPTVRLSRVSDYLEHLASINPETLVQNLLNAYLSKEPRGEFVGAQGEQVLMDVDQALTSAENYLDFLYQRFPDKAIDDEIETMAYNYVLDPPAMRDLIVTHLNEMWEVYFQPEWERMEPLLRESEQAFQKVDFSKMDRLEAAAFITGQEIAGEKLGKRMLDAEQIVFVPSLHVGPYVMHSACGPLLSILFGARVPEGEYPQVSDLSRGELIVRLNALADDTRLEILKLISLEGEKCSSEIMERLELSQSAASRHLTQLRAVGYLTARKVEGAKCYSYNPKRVRKTIYALSDFLFSDI